MPTTSPTIPIIFLAFANDHVDESKFLRGLKKEREDIRAVLKPAEQAGLCKLVIEPNASIKNILDTFQEYQDQIAIFQYGVHANGFQLLLETLEGDHAQAHSEGLVSFFSKQKGLKLIFLNGCSSQQQALDLVAAGIPAVVGTSQSINDDIATKLAVRFYTGMAQGKHIERAWQEATDELKIEKGTANIRDLYCDGMDHEDSPTVDQFPWNIYYRAGASAIKEWDLPEAVANPLFGLPEIPPTHYLPASPFLFFDES